MKQTSRYLNEKEINWREFPDRISFRHSMACYIGIIIFIVAIIILACWCLVRMPQLHWMFFFSISMLLIIGIIGLRDSQKRINLKRNGFPFFAAGNKGLLHYTKGKYLYVPWALVKDVTYKYQAGYGVFLLIHIILKIRHEPKWHERHITGNKYTFAIESNSLEMANSIIAISKKHLFPGTTYPAGHQFIEKYRGIFSLISRER